MIPLTQSDLPNHNPQHLSSQLRIRLQKGVFWNTFGAVLIQGGTFLSSLIVANLLGRETFGQYGMIQTTLLTFSSIAQMAIGYTATKFVAEFRSVDKKRTGIIIGFGSVFSWVTAFSATMLLLLFSPWVTVRVLHAPHLDLGLVISSGYVIFSVLSGFQMGVLAGLENYLDLTKSGFLSFFVQLCSCYFFTRWLGIHGALLALVLVVLVRWLALQVFMVREAKKQEIQIRYRGLWQERTIFLKFGLPAAMNGIILYPAIWLSNAFLVRSPDGFSQLGLFGAASSFRLLVLFFPNQISTVCFSFLSNLHGERKPTQYYRVFWIHFWGIAGVVMVSATAIAVFGSWLLGVFGRDFREGHTVLLILMLSTLFEGLFLAVFQLIQTRGKIWLSFWVIVLPRQIIFLILAYFLTQSRGALGLAISYTISQAFGLAVTGMLARLIGIRENKCIHQGCRYEKVVQE